MKYVMSVSGGKNSTAMFLKCLENDCKIDEVIFCDTCWEYDGVYKTINKIELMCKEHNILFTRLKTDLVKLIKKSGWWPHYNTRYCTGYIKRDKLNKYVKNKHGNDYINMIGFAYDEYARAQKIVDNHKDKNYSFPLIEAKMTEKDCLDYCYKNGFDFGGLYNHFVRLGCAICPFKRVSEIKEMVKYYPKVVDTIRELEKYTKDKYHKYGIEYYVKKFGGK